MTQLHTNLAKTALQLITKMGKSVTIRTPSITYPVNPYDPVEAVSDETAVAVVEQIRQHEIDGTVIQTGDRKYLVAARDLAVAPAVGSRVVDGVEMEIVKVEPVSPGGTDIVYSVICREVGD